MARTALELVGQAGLGYSFDPLVQDKADAYAEAIKALVYVQPPFFVSLCGVRIHWKSYRPTAFGLRLYRPLLPIALKIGTPAIRRRILKLIPSTRLQRMREISDAIDAHSKRIFEEKKQALARGDEAVLKQVGAGKDILSRLSELRLC